MDSNNFSPQTPKTPLSQMSSQEIKQPRTNSVPRKPLTAGGHSSTRVGGHPTILLSPNGSNASSLVPLMQDIFSDLEVNCSKANLFMRELSGSGKSGKVSSLTLACQSEYFKAKFSKMNQMSEILQAQKFPFYQELLKTRDFFEQVVRGLRSVCTVIGYQLPFFVQSKEQLIEVVHAVSIIVYFMLNKFS